MEFQTFLTNGFNESPYILFFCNIPGRKRGEKTLPNASNRRRDGTYVLLASGVGRLVNAASPLFVHITLVILAP